MKDGSQQRRPKSHVACNGTITQVNLWRRIPRQTKAHHDSDGANSHSARSTFGRMRGGRRNYHKQYSMGVALTSSDRAGH
ncbi:hypothetical protein J1614_005250 [Plenodomus biglobosus]|nr:hypothetical protein J1614_005250 [Plenodomus biglobosus]